MGGAVRAGVDWAEIGRLEWGERSGRGPETAEIGEGRSSREW